ncbi:MAG TPA: hypothetical protein PKX38_09520, partial [Alphaproteobacteria bacterium]|nr:hypothetical protein [Alphaproteobacteria bacterium]
TVHTKESAIKTWNTRAQPAVDDAVEAAERIISLAVANCKGFDPSNKYPKVMTDIDTIRTALAQSTQSPGEQPPQTVAMDVHAAMRVLWDAGYKIHGDFGWVQDRKPETDALLTRHEGA